MKLYCISTFLNSIERLTKKPKLKYGSAKSDINEILEICSNVKEFIHISDTLQYIQEGEKKVLVKTRFPNNSMKEGKRGGFRIISIVDIHDDSITFLDIYPKTGKYGKSDLDYSEYKKILETYIESKINDSLYELGSANDLSPISADEDSI